MQLPLLSLLLSLSVASVAAQSLYFTSGTVNSSGNVTLVAKDTSLTKVGSALERLNSTNPFCETQSSGTITNGATSVTPNSSLHNRFYGFPSLDLPVRDSEETASGTYSKHVLNTNSGWLENGVVELVPINSLEGLLLSFPTNVMCNSYDLVS